MWFILVVFDGPLSVCLLLFVCFVKDSLMSRDALLATILYCLSHIMRKPVYAICEQQMRSSASAQSDKAFVVRCLDSIISLVSILAISCL